MDTRPSDLPDFESPPLDEVALSVQFDPIPGLQAPQIGLLWSKFRDQFPKTEQRQPLDPIIEKFGQKTRPGVKLELSSTPPIPRCWFLREDGKELIQIQQDRFIHNWRKVGPDDSYPRYEHVRTEFTRELREFCDFLEEEKIGTFSPNQCEVTYTNVIVTEGDLIRHGELDRIITLVNRKYSDDFLGEPENMRFTTQYIFYDDNNQPLGRLYIATQPAFRIPDGGPIFLLSVTARGAPMGKEINDILHFIDMGREWIVRGFTSVTTPDMHKTWGRKDEA